MRRRIVTPDKSYRTQTLVEVAASVEKKAVAASFATLMEAIIADIEVEATVISPDMELTDRLARPRVLMSGDEEDSRYEQPDQTRSRKARFWTVAMRTGVLMKHAERMSA